MEFRESFEQTYNEAFIIPHNSIDNKIAQHINNEEKQSIEDMQQLIIEHKNNKSSQLLRAEQQLMKFKIEICGKYNIGNIVSRDTVDFAPRDHFGNLPIVAANMDGVTGKRMAEAMAMMGGSAALPQYMSDQDLCGIIEYMNTRHSLYRTPLSLKSDKKIYNFENIISKRDLPAVIITNQDGQLEGILHKRDVQSVNKDTPVTKLMITEELITSGPSISAIDAIDLMRKNKVKFLPILDENRCPLGALTEKSAALSLRYKPHQGHGEKGLAVLATIGALNRDPVEKAKMLINAGVTGIILDTAHFDQGIQSYRNLEKIANLVSNYQNATNYKIPIIAGNVVTPEATIRIISAGADMIKVGIGPGAMCSTRYETAVGRPQLAAVAKCVEAASPYNKHIWADGGIKTPRDVALALAVGASQVMIGSWFAGTLESPGDLKYDFEGHKYKENYGMASRSASEKRSQRDVMREILGHRSEGSNRSFVYLDPERPSITDIIHYIIDGVTSSMTYVGAQNLDEFFNNANIGIQSQIGYEEGKPHDILKIKRI
ncbi:IMP dehydrogenase [Candidatus Uabimicrobium sp. HlEnr_7]|uniref:IMP dehydrogenase n=1 Tax=Candidatus Uabimicrobium helgolandensis TaxID=3095367 RepID=UPI0035565016